MRKVYIILITSIVVLLLLLISWYAVWEILANRITKTYGKEILQYINKIALTQLLAFQLLKQSLRLLV
ncbi:hypothetical protein OTSSIDO_0103 [Orientia tsutsugamushi str. Sido]|nr:hypothetical protein OTSSIDO_0103 [Orientia tsutsugamushi str. Sido]